MPVVAQAQPFVAPSQPAQAPVQPPAQDPSQQPVQAPVQAPVVAPVQAPVQDPSQQPSFRNSRAPPQDPAPAPAPQPAQSDVNDRLSKVESAVDRCQKSKISAEYNAFILSYNDKMQQFQDVILDLSNRVADLESQ